MDTLLQEYLAPYLKPGVPVDCGVFGVGWLAHRDPGRFGDMRKRWPKYDDILGAIKEFDERDIHDAHDYCARVVDFSQGELREVESPVVGDLVFADLCKFDGRGFPAMGIVESSHGDAVFQRWNGGLMRVMPHRLGAFAGLV